MVVARFDGAIAVGVGRQIGFEVRSRTAKVPEQVADHPRVEAIFGAHAAQLLEQIDRVGRLARARELCDRGA